MWCIRLFFKLRASQKVDGHLKVIFVPYKVKMGCLLWFFAQIQQRKEVCTHYIIIRFTPHVEVLFSSEAMSQYSCKNLSKTDEHIKIMQIPCLDINICSMLFSGQVPHRSNASYLFWNLKECVLSNVNIRANGGRPREKFSNFEVTLIVKLIAGF